MNATTRPLDEAAGELACAECGVGVSAEDAACNGREVLAAGWRGATAWKHEMSVCDDCVLLRERAAKLLTEHRRVASQQGSPSVALHRVLCALVALDALGKGGTVTAHTPQGLQDLITWLTVVGGPMRWRARFVPVRDPDARREECATSRWAHITPQQRESASQALRGMLEARTLRALPPVRVLCPPSPDGSPGGCMLCGVASVQAPREAADSTWTPATANPSSIGGRPSPERIAGYLCPVCQAARARGGAMAGVGPTVMERSLLTALGGSARALSASELVGMRAWIVLGIPPVQQPWDFVPNLADLRGELAAAG